MEMALTGETAATATLNTHKPCSCKDKMQSVMDNVHIHTIDAFLAKALVHGLEHSDILQHSHSALKRLHVCAFTKDSAVSFMK